MIPKVIHYCWFGRNPLPKLAKKCILSWQKYFPNYEIKEWNEDNFDVYCCPYTKEAYIAKKYAFVSDYARFWILYQYGGIYFDVDVEVIKPMEHIVLHGPFMGFENNGEGQDDFTKSLFGVIPSLGVNPGLGLGVTPGLALYKEIIEYYENEHFCTSEGKLNLTTVVTRVTNILLQKGLLRKNIIQNVAGVTIYPHEYFCPIRITDGKMFITDNTMTIHHYAASWTSSTHRFLRKVVLFIGGVKFKLFLSRLLRKWKK